MTKTSDNNDHLLRMELLAYEQVITRINELALKMIGNAFLLPYRFPGMMLGLNTVDFQFLQCERIYAQTTLV